MNKILKFLDNHMPEVFLVWLISFLILSAISAVLWAKKFDRQEQEQNCQSYQECKITRDPETCIKWINLDIRTCELTE